MDGKWRLVEDMSVNVKTLGPMMFTECQMLTQMFAIIQQDQGRHALISFNNHGSIINSRFLNLKIKSK